MSNDLPYKLVIAAYDAMTVSGDASARRYDAARQAVSAVLWELGEIESFDPRYLVRDFGGSRPEIVCLCGSTRFYDEFRRQNLRLTLAGVIVLSIGCDTKSDGDLDLTQSGESLDNVKQRLDDLHKRKIDLADRVFVLNVGGYIGESTRGEIEYATARGVKVTYLESVGADLERG